MGKPHLVRLCIRIFILFLLGSEYSQAETLLPPLITSDGQDPFVGSINVTITRATGGGKGVLWYTLTGLDPTYAVHSTYQDGFPILIDKTTTVKAMHLASGSVYSTVTTVKFTKAKLQSPVATYGPSSKFIDSIKCDLAVPNMDIQPFMKYTVDGSSPKLYGKTYPGTLVIKHSTLLRAYAYTPGYEDSDPMEVQFTKLDSAAMPFATPTSQPFTKNPVTIHLTSATPGVQFRYYLEKPTGTIAWLPATGDSIQLTGSVPGEILVLKFQAFKDGVYAPSAINTEKYTYNPQVLPVTASRPEGNFYDTLYLALSSATPGATVRYTLNGTTPTSLSPPASGQILISDSVTVTAIAFKPPQPQSETLIRTYKLKLTAPVADRGNQQFLDTLNVNLSSPCPGAKIYYTLDGGDPTTGSSPYTPGTPIGISSDTTILSAIAVKGKIKSPISRYYYSKIAVIVQLSTPMIEPTTRDYQDALTITLTSDNAAADIRYTLDGTPPTESSRLYRRPFSIDSSATLHVQAFDPAGVFEPSEVGEAVYTLLPSIPTASPAPSLGPFLNQVKVTLATSTKPGTIYYSLGDKAFDLATAKPYTTGEIITLKSTTTIQAVTVLGRGPTLLKSAPLKLTYDVYSGLQTDTLPAGASTSLMSNIVFINSSPSPILATVHSALSLGITGFSDVGLAIQLQSIPGGQPLNVSFSKPTTQTQSLYRLVNGIVEFVSADPKFTIIDGGDYFIGTDTMPPVITLLSQTASVGDSTSIRLWVRDNVANPDCEITSPGMAGGKLIRKPDAEGIIITKFKNPDNEPKGLWFRAQAKDNYNTSMLPKDPLGRYFLSQSWSNLVSPGIFTLGNKDYPWDLAGLPVNAKSPITWAQLKKDNLDGELFGMVLKDSSGYSHLEDGDIIRPGMSFWLGSLKPITSLVFSNFKAGESDSTGAYQLNLHPGWNQISDPALEKLSWPINRKSTSFSTSLVKGLYEFVPRLMDYAKTDSLEPWKGYFVFYHGGKDTTITLSGNQTKDVANKISSAGTPDLPQSEEAVEIGLDFGRPVPLILGASKQGEDGYANEDEPQIPALKPIFSAWSQRSEHHLSVDILHFSTQTIFHWNVMIKHSVPSGPYKNEIARMRISTAKLPIGYQAWALSRATGIKYRLEQEGTLPLPSQQDDSLSIYVGPLAKLAGISELSQAVSKVDHFSLLLEKDAHGQIFVNMGLPWKCRVGLAVFSLKGQQETEMQPKELSEGLYRLPLPSQKSQGMHLLQIELKGENVDRKFTRIVPP